MPLPVLQQRLPSSSPFIVCRSATTVNVTLIEGMTMREIFVRLERSGVASYEDLMEAAETAHFNYNTTCSSASLRQKS